jgi:hypothetical protein
VGWFDQVGWRVSNARFDGLKVVDFGLVKEVG